jgi:hypothetical protein
LVLLSTAGACATRHQIRFEDRRMSGPPAASSDANTGRSRLARNVSSTTTDPQVFGSREWFVAAPTAGPRRHHRPPARRDASCAQRPRIVPRPGGQSRSPSSILTTPRPTPGCWSGSRAHLLTPSVAASPHPTFETTIMRIAATRRDDCSAPNGDKRSTRSVTSNSEAPTASEVPAATWPRHRGLGSFSRALPLSAPRLAAAAPGVRSGTPRPSRSRDRMGKSAWR